MRCKKCGTELKNDDAFCYRCGQRTSVFQRVFSNKTFVGSFIAILIVQYLLHKYLVYLYSGSESKPGPGLKRKKEKK